jgi:hypothetical protein
MKNEKITVGPIVPANGQPWRGLGDVIASATKAVGIKPCGGCKKRQAALNRLMPFTPPQMQPPTSQPDV